MRIRYVGKQPILLGQKFVYQDEVHSVTERQLAALRAQYDPALFVLLDALVTPELLSADNNNEVQAAPAEDAENLSNQTETRKPRRRRKAD